MSTTLLLGAGASFDAGLPMSVDMTRKLLDALQGNSQRLLYFVYGGLLMQNAAMARSTYGPSGITVDVETLFNAVEGLSGRAGLDTAPFVTSWHPLIEQIEAESDGHFSDFSVQFGLESTIGEALRHSSSQGHSNDSARALADRLAKTFAGRKSPVPSSFRSLATEMIQALEGLLTVEDVSKLDYLSPIIRFHQEQQGGLTIATLNYDMLIEQAAAAHGVHVDDGIASWEGSGITFESGALRLIKLHGSIGWQETKDGSIERRPLGDPKNRFQRPALIFGGHNKLRADGPFLDLLWEWRTCLFASDHLVIIGYSFRDPHVNAFIDGWARKRPLSRVTVVSPNVDALFNDTTRRLRARSSEAAAPGQVPNAPVRFVRQGASEALAFLLDEIPNLPEPSLEGLPKRCPWSHW